MTNPSAGVRLHADEIVAPGGIEEHIFIRAAERLDRFFAALKGHPFVHGQRQPGLRPVGANYGNRPLMGIDERLVGGAPPGRVLLPGWEEAGQISHRGNNIGFVDRADQTQLVADRRHHSLRVTSKQFGRPGVRPTAAICHPPWVREMMEGHDRLQTGLPASPDHACVMV